MDSETTSPLLNGDELPDHPSHTTARKIIKHLKVWDATDGTKLRGGIHRSELQMLMAHNQMALQHLYLYAIIDGKIFHTRPAVIIDVLCEDVVDSPV